MRRNKRDGGDGGERASGGGGQQAQGLDPTDGRWYTKREFRIFYGGYRQWDKAQKRYHGGDGGDDWGRRDSQGQAGGRASAGPEGGYRGHGGGGDGAAQHHDRESLGAAARWAPPEEGRPAADIGAPWRGGAGGWHAQGWPCAAAEGGEAPGGSSGSGAHAEHGSGSVAYSSDGDYSGAVQGHALDAPDRGRQSASRPLQLPLRGASPAPRAPQPSGSGGSRPPLCTPEGSPPGQEEGSAPPPGSGTPPPSAPAAPGGAVAGALPQGAPSLRVSSSSECSAARLQLPVGLPQPRGYSRDWVAATDLPNFWAWLDDGGRTPSVHIGGRHFCPGRYTQTIQVILWLADEGKDAIGLPEDVVVALTDWCVRCGGMLQPFPREGDAIDVSSGLVPCMFAAEPQPASTPRLGTAPRPRSIIGRPVFPGRHRCEDEVDAGSATADSPTDGGAQEEDESVAAQIARAVAPLRQQLAQQRGDIDRLQGNFDQLRRDVHHPQAAVGQGAGPRGGAHPGPAPGGGLRGGQPGPAAGGAAAIPAGAPAVQTAAPDCEASGSAFV